MPCATSTVKLPSAFLVVVVVVSPFTTTVLPTVYNEAGVTALKLVTDVETDINISFLRV